MMQQWEKVTQSYFPKNTFHCTSFLYSVMLGLKSKTPRCNDENVDDNDENDNYDNYDHDDNNDDDDDDDDDDVVATRSHHHPCTTK